MTALEAERSSDGTRWPTFGATFLNGSWTFEASNVATVGEVQHSDVEVSRETPLDESPELSRFVSPEAWAVVAEQGVTPENPLLSFLTYFIGMVRQRVEGSKMDTYLSTDPEDGDESLVLRIDASIEDDETRLDLWEELSRDAAELWDITLRNRGLPKSVCPISVLVW